MGSWPTWDEWLSGLDPDDRLEATGLRDKLSRMGAPDPASWARSEVSENIPQLGRYLFLRRVWEDVEWWRTNDAVARVLPDASAAVLEAARLAAAHAAFRVAQGIVHALDRVEDFGPDELPGWKLMETDAKGELTGRVLGGLHESFLSVDPRRIEAEDIRGW